MARSPISLILFLILFLQGKALFAQQKDSVILNKNDTIRNLPVPVEAKANDTIKGTHIPTTPEKSVLGLDTLGSKYNPKKAMLRSAILPGWGQFYNKKYWKIPIIYGALGVSAGVFFFNLKYYKLTREAVVYRSFATHADSLKVDKQLIFLDTQSIILYRNAYRQDIDYSVLAFLILWGLNVVDATVDAHLKAFDVTPDIGMKIRPGFNYGTTNPGISLVFFFKENKEKRLSPLP